MPRHLASTALAALLSMTILPGAACAQETPAGEQSAPDVSDLPAGTYRLDPTHASLIFRVDHLGFSNYTARFTRLDATLEIDPANPAAAALTAYVDPASLETDYPNPEELDFNKELQGEGWLEAGEHPEITFESTDITMTGPATADITGDLTLHGVTQPLTFQATFNGGYPGMAVYDPAARIGFSARGALDRSDFGISQGIPEPGSSMGVSDRVEFIIEAEFTGPPLPEEE